MTVNNLASPSLNPADNDSLVGILSHTWKKLLEKTGGMMPAEVIAYDSVSNTVQIKIAVAVLTTNGGVVDRAPIAKIPVFTFGAGNFLMRFPVKVGDLGWVIANDRDISNFLKFLKSGAPNTRRVKSFSDGVFFPHFLKSYTFDAADADNLVLQNASGSVKIALSDDKITILADEIRIDGKTRINANLNVNGDIKATGSITPNTPIPP